MGAEDCFRKFRRKLQQGKPPDIGHVINSDDRDINRNQMNLKHDLDHSLSLKQ